MEALTLQVVVQYDIQLPSIVTLWLLIEHGLVVFVIMGELELVIECRSSMSFYLLK